MAMVVQLLTAFGDDGGSLLELLVVDGLDVNVPDDDGRTLLSWAAQRGQLDTINWLLHQGALLNASDRAGLTALAWAERMHRDEAACLLRQSGARE